MIDRKSNYTAKVDDLIRNANTLPPAARKAVIELLEEARKRIVGEISALDPNSFSSAQRIALRISIDRILEEFRGRAIDQVNRLEQQAAQIGSYGVSNAVGAAINNAVSLGSLNSKTLAIAQGYTADLITGLSAQAAININGAISRAFLGGQSMTDIVAQIGKSLGGDQFTGIFSTIGERAATIATNEILRVHAMAAQARMEELAARHGGGLKKQWRHIPAARVPRIAHILASGQVRPVLEPFLIDGEELMYPRDPNGAPENTINCHCLAQPYFDDSILTSSDADRGLLADLGLSVDVAAA